MRGGVSFIFVMLLVLRGLLGDAMAMDVAPMLLPGATLQSHATLAAEPDLAGHQLDHAGAPEHGSVVAATPACPAAEASDAADCGHASGHTCSACGICHSALFTSAALAQQPTLAPFALQALGFTPFASAAAALAIKPPIS